MNWNIARFLAVFLILAFSTAFSQTGAVVLDSDIADIRPKAIAMGTTGNEPPVIDSITGLRTRVVGHAGTWTVNAHDPEGGQITYSVIDWGDGTSSPESTGSSFTHTYSQANTYGMVFQAKDSQGATSRSTKSVIVLREPDEGEVIPPIKISEAGDYCAKMKWFNAAARVRLKLSYPLEKSVGEFYGYYPEMPPETALGHFAAGDELYFSHTSVWWGEDFEPFKSTNGYYYKVEKTEASKWLLTFDDGLKMGNYDDGQFLVYKCSGSNVGPDLEAYSADMDVGPNPDSSGKYPVSVKYVVKNIGDSASDGFAVKVIVDNEEYCTSYKEYPGVSAGNAITDEVSIGSLAVGAHTVKVLVKPRGEDASLANDELTKQFTIPPSGNIADLSAYSIEFQVSENANSGGKHQANITCTVKNVENIASGGFEVEVFFDTSSNPAIYYEQPGLSAGASSSKTLRDFSFAPGAHTARMVVTPFGPDKTSANNVLTKTLTVSSSGNSPPAITSISGPLSLQKGGTGSWTMNAYDPEGGQLKYSVVSWGDGSAILPGEKLSNSKTFSHAYSAAGQYTMTFSATDPAGLSASLPKQVTVTGYSGQNAPIKVMLPGEYCVKMKWFNAAARVRLLLKSPNLQEIGEFYGYFPPMPSDVCLGSFSSGDELVFSHTTVWWGSTYGPFDSTSAGEYKIEEIELGRWLVTFDDGLDIGAGMDDGQFEVYLNDPSTPPPIPPDEVKEYISLKSGWNMVSVPLKATVSMADLSSKCGTASIAWRYPSLSGYAQASEMLPGVGYWVKGSRDCSYEVSAEARNYEFQALHKGWNLIGAPGEEAGIIEVIGDCHIISGPWHYDHANVNAGANPYRFVTKLTPSQAYWIKTLEACSLGYAGGPPSPPAA